MKDSPPQRFRDTLFPRIPANALDDFRDFQRKIARRVGVVLAVSVLIILPAFQALDYLLEDNRLFVHLNALWRLPAIIVALVILGLRRSRPDGDWPRPMVLLLAITLMFMMVGIFCIAQSMGGFITGEVHTAQGLIVVIAGVSVAATRGLRDAPVIYGLPMLSFPLVLIVQGVPVDQVGYHLVYPLAMVVVACIIAELIYHGNVASFVGAWQLYQHAMSDPLTGLLNRRAMDEALKVAQARATRHGQGYALIMADLDQFKRVNDEHGHDVGDAVLVDLSRRLQQSLRTEDLLSRRGGGEFLVLIQDVDDHAAVGISEKLRRAVADTPFATSAGDLPITISLGLAVYQNDSSIYAVITRADQALYRAKKNGRNRCEIA